MKRIFTLLVAMMFLLTGVFAQKAQNGENTSAVFNPKTMQKVEFENSPVKVNNSSVVYSKADEVRIGKGWRIVKEEGFESTWPGEWSVYAGSGYTDAYWGDVSHNPFEGNWSGFCANSGDASVTEGEDNYPNNMSAWMVYGPFDLSDATDADVGLKVDYNTEENYDYYKIYASTDGVYYYGTQWSGDSEGYVDIDFDLTDVYEIGDLTGEPEVWIAFVFTSDASYGAEGAYMDDIKVWKYTDGNAINDPVANLISGVYPNPAKDQLTVALNRQNTNIQYVQLANIQGQIFDVVADKTNANTLQLDVSNVAAGIYFVRVATEEGISTQKVSIIK